MSGFNGGNGFNESLVVVPGILNAEFFGVVGLRSSVADGSI
jgi:hypothetical protein